MPTDVAAQRYEGIVPVYLTWWIRYALDVGLTADEARLAGLHASYGAAELLSRVRSGLVDPLELQRMAAGTDVEGRAQQVLGLSGPETGLSGPETG